MPLSCSVLPESCTVGENTVLVGAAHALLSSVRERKMGLKTRAETRAVAFILVLTCLKVFVVIYESVVIN